MIKYYDNSKAWKLNYKMATGTYIYNKFSKGSTSSKCQTYSRITGYGLKVSGSHSSSQLVDESEISLGVTTYTLTMSNEKPSGMTMEVDTYNRTGSNCWYLDRRSDAGSITVGGHCNYEGYGTISFDWYKSGDVTVKANGNSYGFEIDGPVTIQFNLTWNPATGDAEVGFGF